MMRKSVLQLLVLMIGLALIGCGKDPEVVKREYIRSGQQYLDAGKLKEAIIEFRNAIQQDPRFGEARFALAGALLKSGDNQGAYREYQRAADLLPKDIQAQMWAGEMNLVAGRFDDARARADDALAIDSKSVRAQLLMANALAGLKQFDAAVEQAQEAAELDPSGGRTFRNLAVLQSASGDKDAAEKSFKHVVETEPEAMDARVALANFYWSTGRRDVAETVLRQALALEPKSIVVNRALASLYLGSDRLAEAEAPLKLAADETKDPGALVALADYYRATGRNAEALSLLGTLAANPTAYAVATTRKAAILYAGGLKAEGYAAIDDVLQKEEVNITALIMKAQFLGQDGKIDEGLLLAQKAAAANPGAPSAQFAIGRLQEAKGRIEEAIAAYSEVMKMSPVAVGPRIGLARLHLAAGRPDDALRFAQEVTAEQPANEEAVLLRAQALMSKHDLAGAEGPLKSLETIHPRSAVIQAQLGILYALKADLGKAHAAFERALAFDPANADALAGLTLLEVGEKKSASARARLEAALAKNPDSLPILFVAARSYAAMKDYVRTEAVLRHAVETDSTNLAAFGQLGQVYILQNRIDEAIVEFDQLAIRNPKSVTAHTIAGMLLAAQNKRDEAKKRYERALSIDQHAPVAANNLAWMYVQDDANLDVALELAQTAKRGLPGSPEVADTLGWIYYKKGLTNQAVVALKESVEKQPGIAAYKYHLGLAYMKSGDLKSARQVLEAALRLDPKSSEAEEARATLTRLTAMGS